MTDPRDDATSLRRVIVPKGSLFDGDEDTHNVLSIDWIDGIAYRTGLGRVLRAAWDANGYDEINVKLG